MAGISVRSISAWAVIGGAVLLLVAACAGGGETVGETPPPAAAVEGGAPGASDDAARGALAGTVGPGFEISLTQDGQPVSTLPAGTYRIVVDDQSPVHDFHLTGPGVDEATDVAGKGVSKWTVKLVPGEYTFVCDPHASSMRGSFVAD